jgi:hypothetical protein
MSRFMRPILLMAVLAGRASVASILLPYFSADDGHVRTTAGPQETFGLAVLAP